MTLPNLHAMNEHVNSIADECGLVASVEIIEAAKSDVSSGGTRVQCTVANMHYNPARQTTKHVRLEYFNQAGVTVFDQFIREEAAPRLK